MDLLNGYRWLVSRERIEEAKISVAKAHGLSSSDLEGKKLVTAEVDKIRDHWELERAIRGGWVDCFKPKHRVLYRTLLGHTDLHFDVYGSQGSRHGAAVHPAAYRSQLFLLLRCNRV
jgi:hypothetical protein